MPAFPAIEPDARQHSWGDAPQALSILAGGVESRNRLADGITLTSEVLDLSYPFATYEEVELIRAHYRAQGDGLLEFELPEIVVRCDALLLSRGPVWRYLDPPQEDDLGTGRFAVSVRLGAVATTWAVPAITWPQGDPPDPVLVPVLVTVTAALDPVDPPDPPVVTAPSASTVTQALTPDAYTSGTVSPAAVTVTVALAPRVSAQGIVGIPVALTVTKALAPVVKAIPPPPVVSYIGNGHASNPTVSAVAPVHRVGDLLIVVSSFLTSRPFPDLPGFTTLFSTARPNDATIKIQYRAAAGTSYTVPSWGATAHGSDRTTVFVYRNAAIGAAVVLAPSNQYYPSLTFEQDDGSSWLMRIAGEGALATFATSPIGCVGRRTQWYCLIADSNGGTTSPEVQYADSEAIKDDHPMFSIELKLKVSA